MAATAAAAARSLAAAAAAARTSDVKEPQILLSVPDDPVNDPWYHRLLVLQIKGGRWVCLDPELELSVVDLGCSDYILLDRNAVFPVDKYADTPSQCRSRRSEVFASVRGRSGSPW